MRPAKAHSGILMTGFVASSAACVSRQCKRAKAIADFLVKCGVPARRAWPLAVSGKGWWRRAGSPPANEAMTLQWFAKLGLVSLQAHHAALQSAGNRRVR